MKTIAFFNNKGGVGKTTFTFHLGYALERIGKKVLFADLDPQCNLTAHICSDETIDNAWSDHGNSLYQAIAPIVTHFVIDLLIPASTAIFTYKIIPHTHHLNFFIHAYTAHANFMIAIRHRF